MKSIKQIAKELFQISEEKKSRSGGAHEISIFSKVNRSNYKNQIITDIDNLAAYIDHTILKPETTKDDVIAICKEAQQYKFRSVCINPAYVKTASNNLTNIDVCSVVGFPLGANDTAIKASEAKLAIENGAKEIDMVINIGLLKSGYYDYVYEDIESVCDTCHQNNAILKVIIETCLLTREEKIIACLLAKKAGADFVKTSTGFSKDGAKVEDIKLMRKVVGPKMGVKASGGIHNAEEAKAMISAGANRIGASRSVKIVTENKRIK